MKKQSIQLSCQNNRCQKTPDVSLSKQKLYSKRFYSTLEKESEKTFKGMRSTKSSYSTRVSRSNSNQKHMRPYSRSNRDQRPDILEKSSSTFYIAKSITLPSLHKYTSSYNTSEHTMASRRDNDFSDNENSDTSMPLFLKVHRKQYYRHRISSIETKHFESERSSYRKTSQSSFSATSPFSKNTFCMEKHPKNISSKTISLRRKNSTSIRCKKLSIKEKSSSGSLSYEDRVFRRKYYERKCLQSDLKRQLLKINYSKSSCTRQVSSQDKSNEKISPVRKHSKTMALRSLPIDCVPYKHETSVDERQIERNTVELSVEKSPSYIKKHSRPTGKRNSFSISPTKKNTSTLCNNSCHHQSHETTKATSEFHLNALKSESVMQPMLAYQKSADCQSYNSHRKNSLPLTERDKAMAQPFQNNKQYETTKRTSTPNCQENCIKEMNPSLCEEKHNTADMRTVPFQLIRPSCSPFYYSNQLNSCDAYRLKKTLCQKLSSNCSRVPFNFRMPTLEPRHAYSSRHQVLKKAPNIAFHSNFPVSTPYYSSPPPPIYQNLQSVTKNGSPPFCKTPMTNGQFPIPPKLSNVTKNNLVSSLSLEEGEINDTENKAVPISPNNVLTSYQCLNSPKQKMLMHSERIRITSSTNQSEKKKITRAETKKKDDHYVYNEEAWTIDCVTLVPKVLEQLAPGGLLDDTALEFFFRFLHRFVIKKSEQNLFFFFNSYFYTKLMDGGTTARTRHEAVKRWTNRLLCQTKLLTDESSTVETLENIPNKDQTDVQFYNKLLNEKKNQNLKLFIWDFDVVGIPLHDSAHHWTLMLVCYPYTALRAPIESTTPLDKDVTSTSNVDVKTIQVTNLKDDKEEKQDNNTENTSTCGLQLFDVEKMPNLSFVEGSLKEKIDSGYFLECPQKAAIFHLDSLEHTFSSPTHIKETIVEYFQQEFRSRFPSLYEKGYHFADSKEWFFNPYISVPRQKNNYDCGVFLIEYLRYLLTDMQRIQHLLYSSTTSRFNNVTCIKEISSQSNVSNWFPATQVSHRRRCLRKILLLMQKYPHWKTSKEIFEYNGVSQTPLDMMVKLFSSTDPQDLKASNSWETCEKIKYSPSLSVVGD